MKHTRRLAMAALVLAGIAGTVVAAPGDVSGLTAAVTPGDDTKINLSWSPVSSVDGYYVYLVANDPIQTQATVTAASANGTWTTIANAADGSYYKSAAVSSFSTSSPVGVTLTFPSPCYIGAVDFIGANVEGNPGHTTSTYSLSIGATAVASGAAIPYQRNGIISPNDSRLIRGYNSTDRLGYADFNFSGIDGNAQWLVGVALLRRRR